MRGHLILSCALIGACARGPSFVGYPELNGMQSAVVAETGGSTTRLVAVDLRAELPTLEWTLEDATFEVLGFRLGLGELALSAGPIAVVSDEPMRRVPSSDTQFRLENREGRPGAWQPETSRSTSLDAVFLRGTPSSCASFDVRPLNITAGAQNRWGLVALRADGRAALGLQPEGWTYLVSPDGSVEQGRGAAYSASEVDAEGRLWVISTTGELYVGTSSRAPDGLGYVSSGFFPGIPIEMSAGRAADGTDEVYVMTALFTLHRFAHGSWQRLFDFPTQENTLAEGDVERLGPDEALAVAPFSSSVMRYKDGVLTEEPVPTPQGLTLVKAVASVGVVIGAGAGELFLRRGPGDYVSLGDSPNGSWTLAAAPFDDGFVVGGPVGAFMQYSRAAGFCPPIAVFPATITAILPWGANLVVVGDPHQVNASPSAAILVRR